MAVAGAELALVVVGAGGALLRLHAVPVRAAAHEAADGVAALARAAQVRDLCEQFTLLLVITTNHIILLQNGIDILIILYFLQNILLHKNNLIVTS